MATDSETVDGVLMDDDNASYDKTAKRFLARSMISSLNILTAESQAI